VKYTSIVQNGVRFDGSKNVILGNNVVIQRYSWLASLPLTGEDSLLEIKDGSIIGNYNHIYATSRITIEANVLTADKVYISDCAHKYEDLNKPIMHQGIKQLSEITIGAGSWIGENVCVIGASIGKNSIIGANSVVTHDIPDYSVAVGAPARVIKRYNFETLKWEKII
jgi:acetyltransferase-like isoleucine patch superfamily enzyme